MTTLACRLGLAAHLHPRAHPGWKGRAHPGWRADASGSASASMKMLSHSITLCQAHYPEDLAQTFVINAPPHFNVAWNILKGVMNERTRAKIQVSSGDFDGRLADLLGGKDVLANLLNSVQPPPELRG